MEGEVHTVRYGDGEYTQGRRVPAMPACLSMSLLPPSCLLYPPTILLKFPEVMPPTTHHTMPWRLEGECLGVLPLPACYMSCLPLTSPYLLFLGVG